MTNEAEHGRNNALDFPKKHHCRKEFGNNGLMKAMH